MPTTAVQDKATFWKRRTSVVKVHMLLLAHLARESIPNALHKDLLFVLGKSPMLLEELFKVAQVRSEMGCQFKHHATGASTSTLDSQACHVCCTCIS